MKLRVELLVKDIPQENVPGGQVFELLCFDSVIGQYPILQVGDNRISPFWGGIQAEHFASRSLDVGLHNVLDRDLPPELKFHGDTRLASVVVFYNAPILRIRLQ